MSTLSQSHYNLFNKARDLAEFGEHRIRVGCVIARKSRPLVGTFNTIRNDEPKNLGDEYHKHTYHAEANGLRLLPYEQASTGGLTMYVCRINRQGKLKPSKPCFRCIHAIQEQGAVSRIIFWDEQFCIAHLN